MTVQASGAELPFETTSPFGQAQPVHRVPREWPAGPAVYGYGALQGPDPQVLLTIPVWKNVFICAQNAGTERGVVS